MKTKDHRTAAEQTENCPYYVIGTDTFLNGWGGAEGGASYAAWACTRAELSACLDAVRRRSDMSRVRYALAETYQPGPSCAHLAIYRWTGPFIGGD